MEIRKIQAKDKEAAQLIYDAVLTDPEQKRGGDILSFIHARLQGKNISGLYEDSLKAILVYEEEPLKILFLTVQKGSRKKGYGTALLKHFLEEQETSGHARILVQAPASMMPFYADAGFEAENDGGDGEDSVAMEYLLGKSLLGREVKVIVDHPIGSPHPYLADEVYSVNEGTIDGWGDGLMNAYVVGPDEPVDDFTGMVTAVVYRRNNDFPHAVVTEKGKIFDHQVIISAIAFEEQHYDTRIVWSGESL